MGRWFGNHARRGQKKFIGRTDAGINFVFRHGPLYFHYSYPDLTETGPGSGEYGPINHMFPFTPVALHAGWMEGRERILTCVSGNYIWKNSVKPIVHLFGLDGREKSNRAEIKRSKSVPENQFAAPGLGGNRGDFCETHFAR